MDISIDDKIRIVSDSRQFSLQRRVGTDKDGNPTFDAIGYYNTLPKALEALFEYRIKLSDAKTLKEAAQVFKDAHKEVAALVGQLGFRVA